MPVSPLEIAGNVFNLLSVWFSARNSVHTWWSGIVGCALYAVMFSGVRLYADVTLQFFFIASCIVGWWNWKKGGARIAIADGASTFAVEPVSTELPITRVAPLTALVFAALAALSAAGYGALLHGFTDAANPFIDSTVLALSVLAQLLMVARKIETWPVWFAVDCIAVPLYASKGLWMTAAVYGFFLVLVVMGWLRWSKLIERSAPIEPMVETRA
ncbi:MAG: nicotinamide riboside transporter PnuC [Burkholderiaceae bacterium]